MLLPTLAVDPDALVVDQILASADAITVTLRSTQPAASCPQCSTPALRIHSRYRRTLTDLPSQSVAVRVELHVRKFFCDRAACARRVFAERLPNVAAPYARRTSRLADAQTRIAFALGGEAGARLAADLAMTTSADTLLRSIRRASSADSSVPRVLGVDDFAFRRGRTYGTILVDLEQHRPIDLLADREAASLAEWLRRHPGVDVITRDRALAYADGAHQGAPSALQVADRWHLLKNLGDAVERVLARQQKALKAAADALKAQASAAVDDVAEPPAQTSEARTSRVHVEREAKRQRRVDRYDEVRQLWAEGHSKRAIARRLDISRQTVRRLLAADVFPERAIPRRRHSLDRHAEWLKRRWDEGCHNAAQLWRELTERGYRGCQATVRVYLRQWRPGGQSRPGRKPKSDERQPRVETIAAPSPRQAMWMITRREEDIEESKRALRARVLETCAEAATASVLALEFSSMVRERRSGDLDAWIARAKASGLSDLETFARGLERERPSILAALEVTWSNGQVEGQVNRLKFLKRQMVRRVTHQGIAPPGSQNWKEDSGVI
jgi:transposase